MRLTYKFKSGSTEDRALSEGQGYPKPPPKTPGHCALFRGGVYPPGGLGGRRARKLPGSQPLILSLPSDPSFSLIDTGKGGSNQPLQVQPTAGRWVEGGGGGQKAPAQDSLEFDGSEITVRCLTNPFVRVFKLTEMQTHGFGVALSFVWMPRLFSP